MILISLHVNKYKHSLKLRFLLVSFLLFLPAVTYAQDSVVLSVSPTLFEMTGNPQQSWSSSVRVINANSFPITVYTDAVNFAPSGSAGQGTLLPVFEPDATGSTLAEWIDIGSGEIVIPPEQTMSIPFTIRVPGDAPPGGHFAAILIGTRSFDQGGGQALVQTSQVVTSLVFLRVAGDIVEDGNIREFSAERSVYETADASFLVRFQNTGNVHVQPQGEIVISNMWGQERGKIPINNNSQFGNVLPDTIRDYTFTWSSTWSLADVGRHSAVLTLGYGEDTRQFTNSITYFWIIPWKLLLVVASILAAFVGLIVWAIRLYVKRMLQLAGVTPELHRQQKVRVSVRAPLEAGILDLRNELQSGSGTRLARYWMFAKLYKVALIIAAAILVFVVLLGWYLLLLLTSDYSYEVSYEQPDGTTIPIETSDTDINDAISEDAFPLTVINHSGVSDAVAQLDRKLDGDLFEIREEFDPTNQTKDRSVLVYDPAYLDVVTELQTMLPGVLVSSFVSEDTDDPPIILYLGNDLVNE